MYFSLNGLAAFNDSASQIFEQSTEIFPNPREEKVEPALPKKHRDYAQKSTDGRPSYVAEINAKGEIEFVPTNKA